MKARARMNRAAAAFLLATACLGPAVARAAEDPMSASLRAVVEGNIAAYNRKDAAGTMSFVDTKSPDYESTKAALVDQFSSLGATAQLVDFAYMGHDNEFTVARARIKTTAPSGASFTDNSVDAILVFHQENGAWKLWDELILGLTAVQ